MTSDPSRQPKIIGFAAPLHPFAGDGLGERLRNELLELKNSLGGRVIAMCSDGTGAEAVFLRECIRLRIPFIIIGRPCEEAQRDLEMEKLLGVALARYISRVEDEVGQRLLEWADVLLFLWAGAPGEVGKMVGEARDLGIPSRVLDPSSEGVEWQVPPDPARRARHGFATRGDLLDFLDLRFGGSQSLSGASGLRLASEQEGFDFP